MMRYRETIPLVTVSSRSNHTHVSDPQCLGLAKGESNDDLTTNGNQRSMFLCG
jgi:hypothetical protein